MKALRAPACILILFIMTSLFARANEEPAPPASGEAGRVLVLCCPEEQWYPFLYSETGIGKGMFIDIVKRACVSAGFKVSIETYPLNRCVRMAEFGKVDGVIGLPYDKKYATMLQYPPGSAGAVESVWRILQIDEVVVTHKGGDYEYDGNIRSLPEPVRIVQGSAVLPELRQAGLNVEEVTTNRQLFSKLVRDKNGSIVTNTLAAELYEKDASFQGLFDIHATPLRSSSYYLAFSWQSSLTKDEREALWREIRRCRQDYVFMLKLFSQY
jgi:polar amino acid transport system substrate-binding protein